MHEPQDAPPGALIPARLARGPAFVTGGGGFAGGYLRRLLAGQEVETIAPERAELDLLDAAGVSAAVAAARPAVVFHLAAFASPAESWASPGEVAVSNVAMTANLLEAVRAHAPDATVVLVTSGQVYGNAGSEAVGEETPLRPLNPYSVSKAACDMLGASYAEGCGLAVVRVRPFNHAGPGQSDRYVLSALARQVAEAETGGAGEALVRTGDVSAARDFTDVRDVARAYALAAGASPAAYNVSSGHAVTVSALIDLLAEAAAVPVRQETDPERLRPAEAPAACGSSRRLREATGWEPEIPLYDTVADTLAWWRERLAAT